MFRMWVKILKFAGMLFYLFESYKMSSSGKCFSNTYFTTLIIFFCQLSPHSSFAVGTLKMTTAFVLPELLQPKIIQFVQGILNRMA